MEQTLGSMVRCLEEGLPFVDIRSSLTETTCLYVRSCLVAGVHGPTSIGGPGLRASSIVRLGPTQSMKVKTQYLLDTAMGQFGCALAAGQLNIASRVRRTLQFLGENIDIPMEILRQREQSIREEVNMLVLDGTQKGDFDAVKARRALDFIDTLDELSTLDLERNRSSASILVRTFLQTELQTMVGKLRTLNGEASSEPPVERALDWLTMLSSWAAACASGVASEMTTEHEVNHFEMLAEKGVAEVIRFVSRLVDEIEATLDDDQVLELFHSQGLLHQVRAGARKWQVLGVSVDGFEEWCEVAVTRLEAVLTVVET